MTFINSLAQTLSLQATMTDQNRRLSALQQQVATGQKSTNFEGLTAVEARQSMTLRAQLNRNQTYVQNLSTMITVNAALNSSVKSVGDVLSSVHDTVLAAGIPSIGRDQGLAVRDTAASGLDQAVGLLNTQASGIYVFGGRSNVQPIEDSATIQTNVRAAINLGAPPFATVTAALAAANGAFATGATVDVDPAKLASWGPTSNNSAGEPVAIGDDQSIVPNIGVVPNATRTGMTDPRTGNVIDKSYMAMDTVRVLATLAELKPSDFASTDLYVEFVQKQLGQLKFAQSEVIQQISSSGQQGRVMNDANDALQAQNIQLRASISTVESVDSATAITNLQNLQTQLQATYQVTSLLKNLSLVNYLQ
ncbi:MAG: flagellin [Candidatus Pacebacteria bacterium]|nr:flagellin [Candidatus Paceibacterota bacterium]